MSEWLKLNWMTIEKHQNHVMELQPSNPFRKGRLISEAKMKIIFHLMMFK